jgi:hypothetical protein
MNISKSKNIPSIPKSVKLWVAEPYPLVVVELDRSPSAPVSAPLQDPADPAASTRLLPTPQVTSLQDETNLANKVLFLQV